jgi:hypothetical protein
MIHHDPVYPRLQAASAFESRQRAVHLKEDFLCDIPSFLGIAHKPRGEVEDHTLVQGNEPGERLGITTPTRFYEARLRGNGHVAWFGSR